ncbi:MAG: hypothetical protein P8X74_00985 [Reinekea sp.]
MLPQNWGAPAIFEKQIGIKLLHPTSTEEVTDSGLSAHDTDALSSYLDNRSTKHCSGGKFITLLK